MTGPQADAQRKGYGGFWVAGMQLALPMAVLREVVPCPRLLPLPCPAAGVIGGLNLRGVVVPVVALPRLLGRAAAAEPLHAEAGAPSGAIVVIVVVAGQMLGLLADRVSGVFTAGAEQLHPVKVLSAEVQVEGDAASALLTATLKREDDGSLVSVLSAAALLALPQVPTVADPQPQRQLATDELGEVAMDDPAVPMMLVRCGRVALAIHAMAVHATLANPQLQRSVLTRDVCLGVIEHSGSLIPAVDLMALCGLGPMPQDQPLQAFVLQLPAGRVACLIHEVIDVVRTLPQDVLQVPAFALPHPRLFAGALPLASLAADVVARTQLATQQFLLLDGQALREDAVLQGLSETNISTNTVTSASAKHSAGPSTNGLAGALPAGGKTMLTYALGGETATAMVQITEILPYTPDIAIFRQRGPLLGLLVNRGRSIPVLCLSRLAGYGPIQATPAVSILVVSRGDSHVGFAVPALRAIEPAEWEPELPSHTGRAEDELTQLLTQRKLALVGQGDAQRMLRVLDLQRLAAAVGEAATLPG
jgi:purine-binding chemotaxis protein CheW